MFQKVASQYGDISIMMGFIVPNTIAAITLNQVYFFCSLLSLLLPLLLNGRKLAVEIVEWIQWFKSKTSVAKWRDELQGKDDSST
jgi:hypothetical protein